MLSYDNPFFLYSASLPTQASLRLYTPRTTETPASPLYPVKKNDLKSGKKPSMNAKSQTEQEPAPDPMAPPDGDEIPSKETDSP